MTTRLLAAVLGALLAGSAGAQNATDDKALQDAQAELARAARRVAELSRQSTATGAHALRIQREALRKPVLGVLLSPDDGTGVRIAGVTPDGGAAKAGLRAGDRIVSVDGRQLLGSNGPLRQENLRKLLAGLDAKSPVKIGYVRDGRNAIASVTPQVDARLFVFGDDADDNRATVAILSGGEDGSAFAFGTPGATLPAVAPEIRREVLRFAPRADCKDDDCRAPLLLSALRWNGLNMASVDAQLGRYFGTDHGVLVLSSGDLKGLQGGDVIQRIDGKAVGDPREAMAVLRGKAAGSLVRIDYLRDRRPATAQVAVPKLAPLLAPPAPPAPPSPPPAVPKAPPAPPAPPPPPKSAMTREADAAITGMIASTITAPAAIAPGRSAL